MKPIFYNLDNYHYELTKNLFFIVIYKIKL